MRNLESVRVNTKPATHRLTGACRPVTGLGLRILARAVLTPEHRRRVRAAARARDHS